MTIWQRLVIGPCVGAFAARCFAQVPAVAPLVERKIIQYGATQFIKRGFAANDARLLATLDATTAVETQAASGGVMLLGTAAGLSGWGLVLGLAIPVVAAGWKYFNGGTDAAPELQAKPASSVPPEPIQTEQATWENGMQYIAGTGQSIFPPIVPQSSPLASEVAAVYRKAILFPAQRATAVDQNKPYCVGGGLYSPTVPNSWFCGDRDYIEMAAQVLAIRNKYLPITAMYKTGNPYETTSASNETPYLGYATSLTATTVGANTWYSNDIADGQAGNFIRAAYKIGTVSTWYINWFKSARVSYPLPGILRVTISQSQICVQQGSPEKSVPCPNPYKVVPTPDIDFDFEVKLPTEYWANPQRVLKEDVSQKLLALSAGQALDPKMIPAAFERAWQVAAAQPGYQGIPYEPGIMTDPAPASTSDMPGTMTATNPAPAVHVIANPSTDPGTGTNPGTSGMTCGGVGQVACEVTSGVWKDPELPDDAAAADSLKSSILNGPFKSWLGHTFYQGVGECPTVTLELFDGQAVMDSQCAIGEEIRPLMSGIMLVVWAIVAMWIVLEA